MPRQLIWDFNFVPLVGTLHESYYHSDEHLVYNFANFSGGTNIAMLVRYPQEWQAWHPYWLGEVVWGTDDKQYTCILAGMGGDNTKPITGEFWEVGWKATL